MPAPVLAKRNDSFRTADLARCGLFSEGAFLNYPHASGGNNSGSFRSSLEHGGTMRIPGPKQKSALNQGYFGAFERVFEREAYRDARESAQAEKERQQRLIVHAEPWCPSAGSKKSSGKGAFYGTLHGPYEAMSGAVVGRGEQGFWQPDAPRPIPVRRNLGASGWLFDVNLKHGLKMNTVQATLEVVGKLAVVD